MSSYHYQYVSRDNGTIPAPNPASGSDNAWAASPTSPGFPQNQVVPTPAPAQYIMIQPQPQPQIWYSAAPVPEPVKHNYWYGGTKAEIDAKNAATAQANGATKPVQLIPQGATASQQFYCRELDGSYTLRTTNEIMESLQPGYWTYANPGGYPYWVRSKAG